MAERTQKQKPAPSRTEETVEDVPEPRHEGESLRRLVTISVMSIFSGVLSSRM